MNKEQRTELWTAVERIHKLPRSGTYDIGPEIAEVVALVYRIADAEHTEGWVAAVKQLTKIAASPELIPSDCAFVQNDLLQRARLIYRAGESKGHTEGYLRAESDLEGFANGFEQTLRIPTHLKDRLAQAAQRIFDAGRSCKTPAEYVDNSPTPSEKFRAEFYTPRASTPSCLTYTTTPPTPGFPARVEYRLDGVLIHSGRVIDDHALPVIKMVRRMLRTVADPWARYNFDVAKRVWNERKASE